MEARDLAVGLAGGRIAIGVVSLLVPGLVGRAMMGPDGDSGGTRLFLRVVGVRDLALGVGVLVALDRNAPVRGWLRASAVVDGLDAAGCLLARRHLRPTVFPAAAARGDRRGAAQRLAGRAASTHNGPPTCGARLSRMADDHERDDERTKRLQHQRAAAGHERAARTDREAADAAERFGEAGAAEDHREDARRHEAAADKERRRAD